MNEPTAIDNLHRLKNQAIYQRAIAANAMEFAQSERCSREANKEFQDAQALIDWIETEPDYWREFCQRQIDGGLGWEIPDYTETLKASGLTPMLCTSPEALRRFFMKAVY